MTDKERKRGCKGCGSTCGVDGCKICESNQLCLKCSGYGWVPPKEDN